MTEHAVGCQAQVHCNDQPPASPVIAEHQPVSGGASSLQYFKADKRLIKYREGEIQSKRKPEVKSEIKSAAKFCSQKIYPIELQT